MSLETKIYYEVYHPDKSTSATSYFVDPKSGLDRKIKTIDDAIMVIKLIGTMHNKKAPLEHKEYWKQRASEMRIRKVTVSYEEISITRD